MRSSVTENYICLRKGHEGFILKKKIWSGLGAWVTLPPFSATMSFDNRRIEFIAITNKRRDALLYDHGIMSD
jgi:hypothetical protein